MFYDNALAAFADEELDRVRLAIEALRAEIKQRSGGELTRAGGSRVGGSDQRLLTIAAADPARAQSAEAGAIAFKAE